jgi:nitrite reductase/ring-hydroxylating ferredoxin subunit
VAAAPEAGRARERVAFPKSELPKGAKKVVTVRRREIVVINSQNGKLYAVFNRCPHHQAPMDQGTVTGLTVPARGRFKSFEYAREGEILRCPWHHYDFDLENGRCLADPARLRLATYEVREEGEEIAVYA